jgi:predicted transport protein
MLELIHAPKQSKVTASENVTTKEDASGESDPYLSQRISYRIAQADQSLRDLFDAIRQFLMALGDDVQVKELKNYIAFKRLKNFACLEIYPQNKVVVAYLKTDLAAIQLEEGFTRDVTHVGHFGTGNLEVTLKNQDDFVRAQPLFLQSYTNS